MGDRIFEIYVNSNNNLNSDTNEYVFNVNIFNSAENHIYINLKNAVIPYSWYNVNSNNNVIQLLDASNNIYNYEIDEGNYNGINLESTITSLINNTVLFASFTCTYNTKTSKFLFTCNNYFSITQNSTSYDILGLYNANYISTLSSNIYFLNSVKPIDLIPVKCIFVNLVDCVSGNINLSYSINNKSTLCSIPVDTTPNGLIIYSNDKSYSVNTEENNMLQLRISLKDQNGLPIDFNGIPFYFTFEFSIVFYVEEN